MKLSVRIFSERDYFLYIFAALISFLLTYWINVHQDIINPDAICYLTAAERIGQSGISSAMQLCGQAKWPFYSVLIYSIVSITHLSYASAAYLLNGLFSAISIVTFILIVKELNGSRQAIACAAATILFWHTFNSVREYIIRDHGFWAFYLISVLLLLRFFRERKFIVAILWNTSLIVASLFRLEGIFFLLLLPFYIFLNFSMPFSQRCMQWLKLNTVTLFFLLLVAVAIISQPNINFKLTRLSEINDQLHHGLSLMIVRYQQAKLALAQHLLSGDSVKEAGLVLMVTMLAWYIISIITNLTWIYAGLIIYSGWRKLTAFSNNAMFVLGAYLSTNIFITFGFLWQRLFLSKRYLIALSFILILWIPFALADLWKNIRYVKYRWASAAVAMAILFSAAGNMLNFGYSKTYILQAGQWLAQSIPADASLYSNDYQVMYYSHHYGDTLFQRVNTDTDTRSVLQGKWRQYNYLALRIKIKHQNEVADILQEISSQPIKIFANNRGDRVLIFHIN